MTEERDERIVAALESIAVSLARLSAPDEIPHKTRESGFNWTTPWPAPWSMAVTTS